MNPERRIERIRNRSQRRIRKWRRELAKRIGREKLRRKRRIEEVKANLSVTTISERGVEFIADHEGLRLVAYKPDPGEPYWTIGYGHYGPDVKPGMRITPKRALELLREDVKWAEAAVRKHVDVRLNQGEFNALTSFVFNVGAGAFASSTLLRKLNGGDRKGAANEFGRWVNGASGPLPGLVVRRQHERRLFLTGNYS